MKVGDLVIHRFEGSSNDLGLVVDIDMQNPIVGIARVIWPSSHGVSRPHRIRHLEVVSEGR